MTHLLVTNDFPPKVGGIQSYLWELWRRLPSDEFVVLTTPFEGDRSFDAAQSFRVERTRQRVLLPTRSLAHQIDSLAAEVGASSVVLDPALPLGLIGKRLDLPYQLVLHGAEITLPGRLPLSRTLLSGVLRGAQGIIAAGGYPEAEAVRAAQSQLPVTQVPPGVDLSHFVPLDDASKLRARRRLGLPVEGRLVLSVSRLVPRKGMDVLIEAVALLGQTRGDLNLVIAGQGRDRRRLQRLIDRTSAPASLLGRVPFDDLPDLYASADVFAMLCRDRWLGLEQEGFGIVFLEAAAVGVPSLAGCSGGAHEAVAEGVTGLLAPDPTDVGAVVELLGSLLDDPNKCEQYGKAGRARAEAEFSYEVLAQRLLKGIRLASHQVVRDMPE